MILKLEVQEQLNERSAINMDEVIKKSLAREIAFECSKYVAIHHHELGQNQLGKMRHYTAELCVIPKQSVRNIEQLIQSLSHKLHGNDRENLIRILNEIKYR